MHDLINNAWFISIASILITLAVTPALQGVSDWVRSRRGGLTGTYLALSQTGGPESLLAEIVQCQHVGDALKGTITARAEFALGSDGTVKNSTSTAGEYEFAGRLRSRQLQLSYWSPAKASQNGGTMTMVLDASGTIFRGVWSGTAEDEGIITGPCMWIKGYSGGRNMDIGRLAQMTESALHSIANPWHEIDLSSMRLAKLRFMTQALDALKRDDPTP